MKRALGAVGGALLALTSGLGCAEKRPVDQAPPPVASIAADQLLPNELAEGRERAMGLAVPRDMHIERAFGDVVFARGRVGADAVASYLQKRIDKTTAEISGSGTLFPKVHVKGQPPDRVVRIEVVRDSEMTQLILRDVTPPTMAPNLSVDERWRKAGILRGKPFDPNAL